MTYFKLAKSFLLIVGLIVLLGIFALIQYNDRGIDLALQRENWQYFPGATVTEKGIHFLPLNRAIVHQDGSISQPNPPVNINGPHLSVQGEFKITAVASQIDQQAFFRLYAQPPLLYDQWRYESPSIEIGIDVVNNSITVRIWDGSSSHSIDVRTYTIPLKPLTTISLEHVKDHFTIFADNRILGSIPDHHIFDSGTIWFGADGVAHSNGWVLLSLNVKALGTGSIKIIPAPSTIVDQSDSTSLRNVANANVRKIKIGAAVNTGALFIDEQYRNLALGEFSMLTPENSMKPEFIHPAPQVYDFSESDQLVDAALKNNVAIHGHALLYDKSSPDWMTKSNVADRQAIMISHIKNVVEHFKGRVAEWDVLNEPFSKKNALYKNGGTGLESNMWFEVMGEEYIDVAFKTAHAADPAAKLYLNEYGTENNGQRWDALLALVKRLKQRNVPIDGIGFESHIYGDGDYINAKEFKQHMKSLAALGLLTRISEIDVTGDDPKEHINQYLIALDICLKEPHCTSYTTWGITDLYGSTTRSDRYPLVYGTSLLWDKEMKAKPSYDALKERLQQP